MSNSRNWIADTLSEFSRSEKLLLPFALMGALTLGSFVWKAAAGITKYFLLPKRDLFSRYGKGLAIVTGATDGLGK